MIMTTIWTEQNNLWTVKMSRQLLQALIFMSDDDAKNVILKVPCERYVNVYAFCR